MNYIAKQAINLGLKVLIGSGWWENVRRTVNVLADAQLTGAEKRQHAIELLKEAGWKLAASLLNFAIEAAVLFLKDAQNSGSQN